MAKIKKISDNNYLISDETTGEPLATARSEGSGKTKKLHASWHPHILSMHPQASHMLSRINSRDSTDSIGYEVENGLKKLEENKPHNIDIEKDPEPLMKSHEYDNTERPHTVYHFIDHETGNKILSANHAYPKISNEVLGTGDYYDQLKIHKIYTGDASNLNVAIKAAASKGKGGSSLKDVAAIAEELKKTVSNGGPRFVGKESRSASGSKKTYKTTIENPSAAIDSYAKEMIPNHDQFTKSTITPSMVMYHNDQEQHMVKFQDGHIHHVKTTMSSSPTQLNHVIEQVEEK